MYWFWFLKFCDFLLVYFLYNIFKFSFCYIKNFMSYHYLGSVWHRGNGSHDLFNVISKVIVFRSFDDSFFHYVDSWTINASQRYDWGLIQSWFQGVIFWAGWAQSPTWSIGLVQLKLPEESQSSFLLIFFKTYFPKNRHIFLFLCKTVNTFLVINQNGQYLSYNVANMFLFLYI